MDMGQAIANLFDESTIRWTLTALLIFGIVLVRTAYAMVRAVARERTRREVAAYIAEGAMTPEQGERLMRAGEA
jgi:hypothetical protein